MGIVRVLFLADTHLGFDLAFRPRIERRRRGPEFFANFQRALQPALDGRVDCVVHGGDLLFRSRVPARLVSMAFEPLKQVAKNKTAIEVLRTRVALGIGLTAIVGIAGGIALFL